jgi:hypothetical protein
MKYIHFQKLIANSMGDLNLQLLFQLFLSFQKNESHFYGSMSERVKGMVVPTFSAVIMS